MGAYTLAQVPHTNHPGMVTTDQLTLVGMDDDIIDGCSVDIITLEATRAGIPYLDSPVLRAGDHPFPFAVECDTCDVIRVTFEGEDGIGIG